MQGRYSFTDSLNCDLFLSLSNTLLILHKLMKDALKEIQTPDAMI